MCQGSGSAAGRTYTRPRAFRHGLRPRSPGGPPRLPAGRADPARRLRRPPRAAPGGHVPRHRARRRRARCAASARMRVVTYVYGEKLKQANGRCIANPRELARLGETCDEFACYDVEVCVDCRWNHLRRQSLHGRQHAASTVPSVGPDQSALSQGGSLPRRRPRSGTASSTRRTTAPAPRPLWPSRACPTSRAPRRPAARAPARRPRTRSSHARSLMSLQPPASFSPEVPMVCDGRGWVPFRYCREPNEPWTVEVLR